MQVSIRELKAHLSRYLSVAGEGRPIDVTSHRKVVARIVGVPPSGEGTARLLAGGDAQWGGGKPAGAAIQLSAGGRRVSELVLEDRG